MSRDRLRMGLVMGLLIGMCSGVLAAEQHFTARFTSTWGLSLKCHDMVFSPDGKLLAVSPASGRLALVRTRDGQIDREFDFNPFSMGFTRVASLRLKFGRRSHHVTPEKASPKSFSIGPTQVSLCGWRSGSILSRAPRSSIDNNAPRSMSSRCASRASTTIPKEF